MIAYNTMIISHALVNKISGGKIDHHNKDGLSRMNHNNNKICMSMTSTWDGKTTAAIVKKKKKKKKQDRAGTQRQ